MAGERETLHGCHAWALNAKTNPTLHKKLKKYYPHVAKKKREKNEEEQTDEETKKKKHYWYDNLPKKNLNKRTTQTGETGSPAPGTSPLPTPPPPSDLPPSLGASTSWRLYATTTTETIQRKTRGEGCARLSSPPSKQMNTIGSWKGRPAERGERKWRSDCSGRRHPSTRRATST